MRGSNLAIDTFLIIRAVAGERDDGTINLIEQGTDLRAVVNLVGGQRRCDDLASVRINTDVQFTPPPAPSSLPASRPATRRHRTASIQCCPTNRGLALAGARTQNLQRPCPPAERGMVRGVDQDQAGG